MKQTLKINLAYAFFIVMVFSKPAYAYLDPGTGSILLQGLIAAVAGVLATGGIYWNKIKNFFSGNKEKHEQQTNEDKIDE
jgi:uncharacterized membrane protein